MNSEQDFLDAILANPADSDLRQVFADWLEENQDSRAELVRLEEHCRSLPPYCDEYWQLKPRRNELREQCDPMFLQQMDYGTVYLPVFSEVPDDWRSRWRLIREFVERWYQVEMPDVGRQGEDAITLSRQIGRELSPSIVEWMAFTEDLLDSDRRTATEMLRDGRLISDFPEHNSVSLNLQAEGDVHWAVAYNDLSLSDPPVSSYFLNYDSRNQEFQREPESSGYLVSEFAIGYLTSYSTGYRGIGSRLEFDEDIERVLRTEFVSVGRFGNSLFLEGRGWVGILCLGPSAFTFIGQINIQCQAVMDPSNLPPILRACWESSQWRSENPGRAEE